MNLDLIAAQGILDGSTDIYTYVADEELPSGTSRKTSSAVSSGKSPNIQSPTSFRIPSSTKTRPEEHYRSSCSAIPHIPGHAEQDNPQMYWSDVPPQGYDANQGAISSQHDDMLSHNTLFGYRPSRPEDQHIRGAESTSEQSFQNPVPDMGYMGVDISMGIDSMDLDTSGSNLWWDQPFEAIPTDKYGWWPAGGGYEVPRRDGSHSSYGQK